MKVTLLALAAVALCGCELGQDRGARADIAELKRTLGDTQYAWLDPKISFDIQRTEFTPAPSQYDVPAVTYSINLKQHATDFPLMVYEVGFTGAVVDRDGNEIEPFAARAKISDMVGSVAATDKLYSVDRLHLSRSELAALKLRINRYEWAPTRELKPFTQAPPQ